MLPFCFLVLTTYSMISYFDFPRFCYVLLFLCNLVVLVLSSVAILVFCYFLVYSFCLPPSFCVHSVLLISSVACCPACAFWLIELLVPTCPVSCLMGLPFKCLPFFLPCLFSVCVFVHNYCAFRTLLGF